MSRYQREEKELERLERHVRELKKENKSLHKRLKQLSRGYYKFLSKDTEEEAIEEAKQEAKKICWQCSVGEYKLIFIGNRRFRMCQHCGKRGKTSIVNPD
jgi:hypothetical protein